jgi:hypothetical protein
MSEDKFLQQLNNTYKIVRKLDGLEYRIVQHTFATMIIKAESGEQDNVVLGETGAGPGKEILIGQNGVLYVRTLRKDEQAETIDNLLAVIAEGARQLSLAKSAMGFEGQIRNADNWLNHPLVVKAVALNVKTNETVTKQCQMCASHYNDNLGCDEGKPSRSPHRK